MRYLIVSDLHANLEAAQAVLADARGRGYDRVLCLGDIVGYGPNPNEVVGLLRAQNPYAVIRGNHDKVATGIDDGEEFSEVALAAALWTRGALSPENLRYLAGLPQGPVEVDGFLISHGTPVFEDAYLLCDHDAGSVFDTMEFSVAFFGHSHFACAFFRREEGEETQLQMLEGKECTLSVESGVRYLINPGSIGQPRDHDPRAAYAIYDPGTRSVTVHRVAYDVLSAQKSMEAEGLPPALAQRLEFGV